MTTPNSPIDPDRLAQFIETVKQELDEMLDFLNLGLTAEVWWAPLSDDGDHYIVTRVLMEGRELCVYDTYVEEKRIRRKQQGNEQIIAVDIKHDLPSGLWKASRSLAEKRSSLHATLRRTVRSLGKLEADIERLHAVAAKFGFDLPLVEGLDGG